MAAGLPVVAPAAAADRRARRRTSAKALLYDPAGPERARRRARAHCRDPALRARLGAAARERAVRDYSWAAHCRALDAALRAAGDRAAMNILLVTDAFPPVCGGSGWSTYELARGLRARGHTRAGRAAAAGHGGDRCARPRYDGFRVLEFGASAPPLPYVRNYFKNERLYRAAGATSSTTLIPRERIDIVHGQHVLTGLPSIDAGAPRAASRRSCTVRDYWPVCYWSDLIHTPRRRCALPGLLARR